MAIRSDAEKDIGGKLPPQMEIILISPKGIKYGVYVNDSGELLTKPL